MRRWAALLSLARSAAAGARAAGLVQCSVVRITAARENVGHLYDSLEPSLCDRGAVADPWSVLSSSGPKGGEVVIDALLPTGLLREGLVQGSANVSLHTGWRGFAQSWRDVTVERQHASKEEAARIASAQRWNASRGRHAFFEEYRSWKEQLAFLDDVLAAHPSLITRLKHGQTREGREIPALRVTAAPADRYSSLPVVFVQAGAHARERLTSTTAWYLVDQLTADYARGDKTIRDTLENVVLYIVPLLNIDGFEYSMKTSNWWRKNRVDSGKDRFGVDLNRNWGPASSFCTTAASKDPASEAYCGEAPFSEPEVSAGRDFIEATPNLKAVADLHTSGEMLLWPWNYKTEALPESDRDMFVKLGERIVGAIQPVDQVSFTSGQGSRVLYSHSGGMADYAWIARRAKAFTFEGRGPQIGMVWYHVRPAAAEQYAGLLELLRDVVESERPAPKKRARLRSTGAAAGNGSTVTGYL